MTDLRSKQLRDRMEREALKIVERDKDGAISWEAFIAAVNKTPEDLARTYAVALIVEDVDKFIDDDDDDDDEPAAEPPRDRDRWERVHFRIAGRGGFSLCSGCGWHCWAIHTGKRNAFRVTHMPSGYGAGDFPTEAIARRFCEEIDGLADWSIENILIDGDLNRAVSQAWGRVRAVSIA